MAIVAFIKLVNHHMKEIDFNNNLYCLNKNYQNLLIIIISNLIIIASFNIILEKHQRHMAVNNP